MKSTIKKIKDIDYKTPIVVPQLMGDDNSFYNELSVVVNQLKPKLDAKQINEFQVHQMVSNNYVVRNIIEIVKNTCKPCFTIDFDDEELTNVINEIKPKFVNIPEDKLPDVAKNIIYENLLFYYLADEWNITVTDEEANEALDKQYQELNIPIREIKNDKEKFNNFKKNLLIKKVEFKEVPERFNISVNMSLTKPITNWKILYLPNPKKN